MVWERGKELNNGKFIVVGEKPLGSGGFGITYKVARTRDHKLFVIKTLNAIAQSKSNFRQLQDDFLNEAHTLAGFKHNNIVKIYPKGFTEQEDELWCMVMEFIEGQDLKEYLEENKEISEIDAIALITKVGEALAYIHQSSYVHRDIKPSNIMLHNCNLSFPVLIDFGLAREFDHDQSLTMDNRLTEHFAPLEQYNLDSYAKYIDLDRNQYRIGTWTDVYALAATLYNLLTHEPPMPSPIRSLSPKDFKSPKQLNPNISDRTNAAILEGMSLNPKNRSPTIPEWLDLLSGSGLNNGSDRSQESLNQIPNPGSIYTKLYKLLAEKNKWREADCETLMLFFKLTGRQQEGWLRTKDIKKLDCSVLRQIDQLWVKFSNGKFGFSIQKELWTRVGGQPGKYSFQSFCKFGDLVGWRQGSDWLRAEEFTFSLDAPEGHFPTLRLLGFEQEPNWWGSWERSFKGFLSLSESCSL